jgi:hypothetical protein
VVSVWGVEMSCVCEPPSDHETKLYVLPPETWGEGAPSVRVMFTTPSTLWGAVKGWPSSVSCSPVGLVWKVIVAVRGTTSTYVSAVSPPESTAERWMRYQTFADVSPSTGTTNEPPVIPLVGGMKGWKWVSWWKLIHHVNDEGGRDPSSGSSAEPE